MALDRTWYNTLVDDSGDGISGSVWDKADVDSLMDAVDAELAFTVRTYAPTWYAAGAGSTAIGNGALTGEYVVIGSLTWFSVKLNTGTTTAIYDTGDFAFTLPPGRPVFDGLVAFSGWAWNIGGPDPKGLFALHAHCLSGNDRVSPCLSATSPVSTVNINRPFSWSGGSQLLVISGVYR